MDFNMNNGAPAPMGMGGAPAPMGGAKPVINLSKGQRISLSKEDPSLKNIMVGLGWDTNKYSGGAEFDLDASVFLCDANNVCRNPENDFIFYQHLKDSDGCCVHQGDNRTGEGDGDDEQVLICLDKVPQHIQRIGVTVTIYEADMRKQNFGLVSNAFIRLVNQDTTAEFARFDLAEEFSTETALVVAEFYRNNGEWKFNAIGSGFAGGLSALCGNYGFDAR